MVVISAIMQWLHNAGWTSLSVVANKRKRQFVKFAMSKECVYLAPWENRTTSIVYFDLFIYLRLWDIESFKMYTFGCFIVPSLKSANIGSDLDCTQQSQIFFEIVICWTRLSENCRTFSQILLLPSSKSLCIWVFHFFQHILYSYREKSWNSLWGATLWWLFGKRIL